MYEYEYMSTRMSTCTWYESVVQIMVQEGGMIMWHKDVVRERGPKKWYENMVHVCGTRI